MRALMILPAKFRLDHEGRKLSNLYSNLSLLLSPRVPLQHLLHGHPSHPRVMQYLASSRRRLLDLPLRRLRILPIIPKNHPEEHLLTRHPLLRVLPPLSLHPLLLVLTRYHRQPLRLEFQP